MGIDFTYDILDGLQLTGSGTAALLAGTQKNYTPYASISPALADLGITPPNTQKTTVCSAFQIVPAFAEKLGLAYAWECTCARLYVEVGSQAIFYVDALHTIDIGSAVITPPVTPDTVGVFARTFQQRNSNFSLAGPYMLFNVGF